MSLPFLSYYILKSFKIFIKKVLKSLLKNGFVIIIQRCHEARFMDPLN